MVATQQWPCSLGCPPLPAKAGDERSENQSGSTSTGSGTEGGRRCPKTEALSRSDGGAALRRELVEPASVVPAGDNERLVVHNACAASCASGRPRPTYSGKRRQAFTWKQKTPTPREGPPSTETRCRTTKELNGAVLPQASIPREGPPSTEPGRGCIYSKPQGPPGPTADSRRIFKATSRTLRPPWLTTSSKATPRERPTLALQVRRPSSSTISSSLRCTLAAQKDPYKAVGEGRLPFPPPKRGV